jgi:hypothetical protein
LYYKTATDVISDLELNVIIQTLTAVLATTSQKPFPYLLQETEEQWESK